MLTLNMRVPLRLLVLNVRWVFHHERVARRVPRDTVTGLFHLLGERLQSRRRPWSQGGAISSMSRCTTDLVQAALEREAEQAREALAFRHAFRSHKSRDDLPRSLDGTAICDGANDALPDTTLAGRGSRAGWTVTEV
jgi:hypothetical protein